MEENFSKYPDSVKNEYKIIHDIIEATDDRVDGVIDEIISYSNKTGISPSFFYFPIIHSFSIRFNLLDAHIRLLRELIEKTKVEIPLHILFNDNIFRSELYIILKYGFAKSLTSKYIRITYKEFGKEHKEIREAIIRDDIDELMKLLIDKNMSVHDSLNFDSIEYIKTYSSNISIIDYAALHGSVKCFKYAIMNDAKYYQDTQKFAIEGGNVEIIHILEQKGAKFENLYMDAIGYHRNDIADWLYNNTNVKIPEYCDSSEFFGKFNYPAAFFARDVMKIDQEEDSDKLTIQTICSFGSIAIFNYFVDQGFDIYSKGGIHFIFPDFLMKTKT